MQINFFDLGHINCLDEAISISEEIINNYYCLSNIHWIKNPYEVRTLKEVDLCEHPGDAFAHLVRYKKKIKDKQSGKDVMNFYRICLHDHNILDQTSGGNRDKLLPFLLYVITHELIHIMRFSLYYHYYNSYDRLKEEQRVHLITRDILFPVKFMDLDVVLERFQEQAGCLQSL